MAHYAAHIVCVCVCVSKAFDMNLDDAGSHIFNK